jgi:hypothetical protein
MAFTQTFFKHGYKWAFWLNFNFENYLPQVKRFILVANNLVAWLSICIEKTKQT